MRDTITRYFDEVGQLSLPTKDEERTGFIEYRALKLALETMVDPVERTRSERKKARLGGRLAEGYLRFVIGKARERTRDKELLTELISAGNVGLMIAVDKYDPNYRSKKTGKPVRFLTYAAHWVGVKMDEVLHRLGTVHISVHLRKQTLLRGDGPPDPVMTPIEDVQVASDDDVEEDATPKGRAALGQLHAAGLDRKEKVVLLLLLGLRGVTHEEEEAARILYVMDGSVFLVTELREIRDGALEKMRRWHASNPEARGELVTG
jgi:hypothetical protein